MRTWYASPTIPQHTLNFLSPDKCRCEQKAHPRLGACQSEKQELELARSLCDSGSITNIIVRPLFKRVEKKEASYGAGRDGDAASAPSRRA